MEGTYMRFGKDQNTPLEEMALEQIVYYVEWYGKAIDNPKYTKYKKENNETFEYILSLYIPLLQLKCIELAEELLINMNKNKEDLRIVDKIFKEKTVLNKFLTEIITDSDTSELEGAINILNQLIQKVKEKVA